MPKSRYRMNPPERVISKDLKRPDEMTDAELIEVYQGPYYVANGPITHEMAARFANTCAENARLREGLKAVRFWADREVVVGIEQPSLANDHDRWLAHQRAHVLNVAHKEVMTILDAALTPPAPLPKEGCGWSEDDDA